jgi:S1-C subfamily serine protease
VWDREGHIVTNNHVVAGAEEITVTFYDYTTVSATVVGTDSHSDLAVLKVDLPAEQLNPVQVADSTRVEVGNLAVAIGNPFGLDGTMTVGFVSALGRSLPVTSGAMSTSTYSIPDIIQTDAPINPGNSGGVLVDDEGRVIGVPTAIESPVQANAGIGFAIPSVIVQKVVPVLIQDGEYEHPWLGISGTSLRSDLAEAMELAPDQRGVLVAEVVDGSPAAAAGLRGSDRQVEGQQVLVGGDVIVAINGEAVGQFGDLVTYLARNANVGETVTLTVVRGSQEELVRVTLAARPQEEPSSQADRGMASGAWLGVQGLTLTPEIAEAMDLPADQQGVLVVEVIRDTPADQAGLRGGDQSFEADGGQTQIGGDVIIAVDGQAMAQMEDLAALMRLSRPGQEVTLSLLRDGQEVEVSVTLGERPMFTP